MARLYPQDVLDELRQDMEDMTVEEDDYPRVYNAEDWCEDEEEDDEEDDDDDDDDNHQLATHLNQYPEVLSSLLTTIRDMNESILSLHAARVTLEKNLRVAEGRVSVLEKKVGDLEFCTEYFYEQTVPKTLQMEKDMANWSRAQSTCSLSPDSSDVSYDQLKTLRDQAVEVYTPEVCCHFVKPDEKKYPTTSDKLVLLAQKIHRFRQIKNLPNSNFWTHPKPLELEVEERLRSLPLQNQQEQMNAFWREIEGIFRSPNRRTILLFEMEELENRRSTVEEKKQLLQEYIQTGLQAQKEMKNRGSFLNTMQMGGHKKTKKMED